MKDFYYILGTANNATAAEIDVAYNKLAKRLGPQADERDHFLEAHLLEINEAYQILSDPVKRRRYDEILRKTHKRQLANFKVKYLNTIAALALIAFTAMFGYYVVRSTSVSVKPVQVVSAPVVANIPHKLKHHKRKHRAAFKSALANSQLAKTQAKPIIAKKDTVKYLAAKPTGVVTKPVPVITKLIPVVAAQSPVVKRALVTLDSTYVTYLKPNLPDAVYLHETADYMSDVLTTLPDNSRVRVMAKGRTFYKIAFNNQVGFVPKWTLSTP